MLNEVLSIGPCVHRADKAEAHYMSEGILDFPADGTWQGSTVPVSAQFNGTKDEFHSFINELLNPPLSTYSRILEYSTKR